MLNRFFSTALVATALLPGASWSQVRAVEDGSPVDVKLAFVQTSTASDRAGLSIPADDALRLKSLKEVGKQATGDSIRQLGEVPLQPVLQARIGEESVWAMQERAPAPILRDGQPSSLGPGLDFGVRLGVTVHPRKDGRLRVFVRTTVTGVDFEKSVEGEDGVVFPSITTSGATLYKDIQPGETVMLTGLMDQESRRVLRRTPTDSKSDLLTRLTLAREKPGADQLILLITPELAK